MASAGENNALPANDFFVTYFTVSRVQAIKP